MSHQQDDVRTEQILQHIDWLKLQAVTGDVIDRHRHFDHHLTDMGSHFPDGSCHLLGHRRAGSDCDQGEPCAGTKGRPAG